MNSVKQYVKMRYPKLYEELSFYKTIVRAKIHSLYSTKRMQSFISKKYKRALGYDMDWENPRSYTQKIQYTKLFNKNKMKTICSDKIAVREFVTKRIGEKYLVPIYGIWEAIDDINFDLLPNQFVLKTNQASGTNIIVKNKVHEDLGKIKKTLRNFLKIEFGYLSFEKHYLGIQPLIYAEQYLDFGVEHIEDYKFLCFNEKVYCVWVDIDRFGNHKRNVYDLNWNLLSWNQYTYGNYKGAIQKPKNFDEMVNVANALCKGFDHVRVDLYNINGQIYFGELTFTNGSGFEPILPREMDFELGKLWDLTK